MTPEEAAQIKKMIVEHDSVHEPWSFKKFFMGFFRMQNGAKAIVIGFWLCLILFLGYGAYRLIFHKQPTQAIGTNTGTVVTNNEDKRGNSLSLFNIFNSR